MCSSDLKSLKSKIADAPTVSGKTTHRIAAEAVISDDDVIQAAQAEDTTRAVQAMRKAHRQGLLDGAIVGIGNAPTALIELVRLIREEGVRPALVVGMPVGFVSAQESKDLMAEVQQVPWIVIRGRKGEYRKELAHQRSEPHPHPRAITSCNP